MTLVDRIRNLCEQRGETLASLERALNFSKGSIRKWDTNFPSVDRLNAVAGYLNVSLDYLAGRSDEKISVLKQEDGDDRLSLPITREALICAGIMDDSGSVDQDRAYEFVDSLLRNWGSVVTFIEMLNNSGK